MAIEQLTIRALTRDDLPAVVAIDIEGRSRRDYVERRLAAALREPRLHAQFAASDAKGLAGYILARVLEGEFGRSEPGLRLEMVGVRPDARGHGAGARLFQVLTDWARRHAIRDAHTTATWRDAAMLGWLGAMGFRLAPSYVLDVSLDKDRRPVPHEGPVTLPRGHGPGAEVDFGAPQANDDERMASERPEVRAMRPDDLREIVRIDRGITGRDRGSYIEARLAEAMHDSAIRVSLAARRQGAIVGFVMARADLGDYGRAAPVAVVDTIGVDVGQSRRQVGRVLLEELFANLAALQIERVETLVASTHLPLLGFFQHNGFRPSQRLAFKRRLDA
ncbi:GNAT family N-acetyltransferase [Ramlibacter sp.]|uniref:GNAT family N-acetyltransferase n=1 Tax=Ramlibacter sp. TaxID=1917967 RepID=UPI002B92FDB5|nr:GNAT family N-acetyltransferase [Ramlibacter sp.]HWI80437.1 GNAT family N-acetyltransferase [Ramlibacter sp.]